MTFRDLRDFHDVMVRAYMRNLMFVLELPYHLAHEMRRQRASEQASEPAEAPRSSAREHD
jgi:hypothetical protein